MTDSLTLFVVLLFAFRISFSNLPLGDRFSIYYLPSKGGKEVRSMQSATERRQMILEDLSDKRFITRESLAGKFGVSVRTISRDIELLSCSAPLYTTLGKGGGIRAADGWYLSRRYLRDEQEALLRKLAAGLQPADQKIMQGVLAAFAKPQPYKEAHQ